MLTCAPKLPLVAKNRACNSVSALVAWMFIAFNIGHQGVKALQILPVLPGHVPRSPLQGETTGVICSRYKLPNRRDVDIVVIANGYKVVAGTKAYKIYATTLAPLGINNAR